jgi:lysophospholipase L1-like esterase
VRTKDKSDLQKPIFAHYEIGKNDYPLTKIEDFSKIMDEGGLGSVLDISFMKFCFVDIHSNTDIKDVFNEYKKNISQLKKQFPNMKIIHFTVPLLRKENNSSIKKIKNLFKGIMGKKKDNFFSNSNNVARNKYNNLLVDYYSGKDPVFDLARFESTDISGQRETFSYDGSEYYALVPAYTEDGGHLNEKARKYIAAQLLVFLAEL